MARMRISRIKAGDMVIVRLSHRADLGLDPNMGYVHQYFPATHKVKVTWCNGTTSTHDTRGPYMARFEYYTP